MNIKNDYCRLCSSKSLLKILDMPIIQPVDNFRYKHDIKINYSSFSMDLYMCNFCGHAQLLDIVDPEILFGNYIYTSSSSPDLDSHFTKYSEWLNTNYPASKYRKILDIGSNDGLFLSKLIKYEYSITGIDASKDIAILANNNNIPTIVNFFDENEASNIKLKLGTFNIITANNVFSHSNNLLSFIKGIEDLLDDNGLFIFEVFYLLNLVNDHVIDYIYHEHLAHHSLIPLINFFNSNNLKLINYLKINVKGGSIRCVAAKKNSLHEINSTINIGVEEELNAKIYEIETYKNIQSYFNKLSIDVIEIIKTYKDNNFIICSYGASATSIVLNNILSIDQYINFIVDDNVIRQGRLSPTNKVPVISPDKFDDVFDKFLCIISAWRFANIIIDKNKLKKAKITYLLPLPQLKIIET